MAEQPPGCFLESQYAPIRCLAWHNSNPNADFSYCDGRIIAHVCAFIARRTHAAPVLPPAAPAVATKAAISLAATIDSPEPPCSASQPSPPSFGKIRRI